MRKIFVILLVIFSAAAGAGQGVGQGFTPSVGVRGIDSVTVSQDTIHLNWKYGVVIRRDTTRTTTSRVFGLQASNTGKKDVLFSAAKPGGPSRVFQVVNDYIPTGNNATDVRNGDLFVVQDQPVNSGVFSLPVSFPNSLPFRVANSRGEIYTPFSNVQETRKKLSGIPVNPTVKYVSLSGDNSTGDLKASAYNQMATGFASDPDVIMVDGGGEPYFLPASWAGGSVRPAAGTKNLAVIGYGGRPIMGTSTYITTTQKSDLPNLYARRGYGANPEYVFDMREKDEIGAFVPLKVVGSKAECSATPNSTFSDVATIDSVYINLGGEIPVHGVNYFVKQIITALFIEPAGGGRRIYVEGIDFYGEVSAEEGDTVVFNNCRFLYSRSSGIRTSNGTSSWVINSTVAYSEGDNFGVFGGRHYHINSKFFNAGHNSITTDFNNQNSSLHNAASLVSINSFYKRAFGQNVADTGASGASFSVYLNAEIGDTWKVDDGNVTLQPAVTASNASIWLQGCRVGGLNSFDFRCETGGNIFVSDTPFFNPSVAGTGTFQYWE